jgi:signal-transduction protein with cAMP-binding, CBS, and nucleotidyltransferase domain
MYNPAKLKQYLELFSPLPEKDWEFFLSKLQQRNFSKKEMILSVGKVEDYVSFIESGHPAFRAGRRKRNYV